MSRAVARTVRSGLRLVSGTRLPSSPSSLTSARRTAASSMGSASFPIQSCISNDIGGAASRSQHRRAYHSAPVLQQAVRRRRRKVKEDLSVTGSTGEGDKGNPLKHDPVLDPALFVDAAERLVQKLTKALAPMQSANDVFVMTRTATESGPAFLIELSPENGTYRVDFHVDEVTMEYSSPVSGKNLYVLSDRTNEWVGSQDGHVFEGILVRDLIRQCKGLPNL